MQVFNNSSPSFTGFDYIPCIMNKKQVALAEKIYKNIADSDVFKKADDLGDREGDLKGFIGVIARCRAIDMYRKLSAKAYKTISSDDEGIIELSSGENVAESVEMSERNSIIYNKIKELGEPDTSIIVKQYYYNMTVSEIGRVLSMTAAAVQKRSIRAREKLKKMLSEAGINY